MNKSILIIILLAFLTSSSFSSKISNLIEEQSNELKEKAKVVVEDVNKTVTAVVEKVKKEVKPVIEKAKKEVKPKIEKTISTEVKQVEKIFKDYLNQIKAYKEYNIKYQEFINSPKIQVELNKLKKNLESTGNKILKDLNKFSLKTQKRILKLIKTIEIFGISMKEMK